MTGAEVVSWRRKLLQPFQRRRVVLFSAHSAMNVAVMQPILDALRGDPRLDLFFTGRWRRRDEPERLAAEIGLEGIPVLKRKQARRLRGDLYLSPDGSRYGKRCLTRVLIFHGMSFKGRTVNRRARWFHRVFLVGPYQRRRFVERGILAAGDRRMVEVGMPKLDRLARGSIDATAVRRRLGVADGERLLLYAPTWTDQSSLPVMGEALLAELAKEPLLKIAVKLHDHLFDPTLSAIDWRARGRGWTWPNVRLVEEDDVVPLLAAADVLLTDASSVAQEFAILDRPILFADVPALVGSDRYKDTIDLETWGRKGGLVVKGPADVRGQLHRALARPDEHSAVRRALVEDVFFAPGTATQRALKRIYADLRLRPCRSS